MTEESVERKCSLVEGPSRSSHWIRTVIRRSLYLEAGLDSHAQFFSEAIPFVNLCPIPKYERVDMLFARFGLTRALYDH